MESGYAINSPIAAGSIYDRAAKSEPRAVEPDQMNVGSELALLRVAIEQAAMRAEQLIERLEPVSDLTTDVHPALGRELPPATSKVGAELRDMMGSALRIADRLSMAAEALRL